MQQFVLISLQSESYIQKKLVSFSLFSSSFFFFLGGGRILINLFTILVGRSPLDSSLELNYGNFFGVFFSGHYCYQWLFIGFASIEPSLFDVF